MEVAPVEAAPLVAPAPDELALLARAQRELRRGDAAAALASVAAHRAQFPSSPFDVERDTLDALANCELGRVDDARRGGARILRDHPHSPSAERLRRSCVAGADPTQP